MRQLKHALSTSTDKWVIKLVARVIITDAAGNFHPANRRQSGKKSTKQQQKQTSKA